MGRGARRQSAPTPAEAARGADFVFACVGNDDDLRRVTLGATAPSQAMCAGAIFVDHTTASAEVARELAAGPHAKGWPSSTRRSRAATRRDNGELTVMCGGDAEAFAAARPVAMAFAKAMTLLGPGRRGPARQDGQPDLHRRPGAGPGGGDRLRPSAPAST